MRIAIVLLLLAVCSPCLWSTDRIVPPNIKLGLWEVTETHTMTGMPPMPAEALAKMTPEQRAQMEAHMKQSFGGAPKTTTRKDCVTKEELERNTAFADNRKECTHTVLRSSSALTEVKIHCQEKEMTSDGTFTLEALTTENVKGTMRMVVTGNGRTMHMDFDFTSKYLSPACGDVSNHDGNQPRRERPR